MSDILKLLVEEKNGRERINSEYSKERRRAAEQIQKPFRVEVGHLTVSKVNPVTLYIFDENGDPRSGQVLISLGQRGEIDGQFLGPEEDYIIEVGNNGYRIMRIKVLERNNVAWLTDIPTGFQEQTYLRNEE